MFLSKSGDTFVLSCECKAVSFSFCDSGIEIKGSVRCGACGTEAQWGALRDENEEGAARHGETPGDAGPAPSAEIHVLYP